MHIGRIIFFWILLFLVSFVFIQFDFIKDLIISSGTTETNVFVFMLVFGLIIIVLVDALSSD